MRVVILNKSDNTGGAAVVSMRLLEALRKEGVDARMLVIEKLTDSPFVEKLNDWPKGKSKVLRNWQIKKKFLLERLKIFIANGFNRSTLFKIDTGADGLPLRRHPLVKEADAILINWVNQGMLSLEGYRKILETGKPVVWTMHDMWEMTGICHHAGRCRHYFQECGECVLLGKKSGKNDLSHKIWRKKSKIYKDEGLMKRTAFVAVSSWLKEKSKESSLLCNQRVEVIPNAFPIEKKISGKDEDPSDLDENLKREIKKIRLLFVAARLDDPIKGLDTLKETSVKLSEKYPEAAGNIEIAMLGAIKDESVLEGFGCPVVRLGMLRGEKAIRETYENADIVVSASSYETLPGTMVEAQAYGCIPVSFNQGGQKDIIETGETGFIAEYSEDLAERSDNLSRAILRAIEVVKNPERRLEMQERMKQNVENKFSYQRIACEYIKLIKSL